LTHQSLSFLFPFLPLPCIHSCLYYYYHFSLGSTSEQEYLIFGLLAWLISLSMMISSSIHFPANYIISFLWYIYIYIYIYTHTHTHTHTHILSIQWLLGSSTISQFWPCLSLPSPGITGM
jgi:hypothetical protein